MTSRVLVLNQSWEFLGTKSWQDAISDVWVGSATVLETYDRIVRSPSIEMRVPAVIALRQQVQVSYDRIFRVSFSSRNVFLRDSFLCQYCEQDLDRRRFTSQDLSGQPRLVKLLPTLDHVLPASRGGKTTWENTVTACKSCNKLKGDRTPVEAGMSLLKEPRRPQGFRDIMLIKLGQVHDLWKKYLGL